MKQIVKAAIFIIVIFLAMIGSFSIRKHRLGGFRLSKTMKAQTKDSFPIFSNDEKLDKILSNSYYYLGRGTQFYAFVSVDQKHVIKILRSDRLTVPIRKRLFSAYVSKIDAKNKKRKANFLNACKIASNQLRSQTGVVYIHMDSTVNLPKINIIDNFGFSKKVDLNGLCFLIQKKAKLVKDSFIESKKQNDLKLAKKKISSFFYVLKSRAENKISNKDPNVFQNFGFINDQAVEIDFGDFYNNPHLLKNNSTYVSEIDKYALVLRGWLVSFWPELIPYFDKQHNFVLQR